MTEQKQPKKILYVENGIGYGGAIICLRHLVRNLERSKYLPMVITGRTGPQYREIGNEALWKHIPDRHFDIAGAQRKLAFQTWPDKIPGLRFLFKQILARLDDLLNFLPFFISLLWTAWNFKADLIHANNEPLCNRAALLVAKCLQIPSICHVRGDQKGSRAMSWAYSLPNEFISVSNWVADSICNNLDMSKEKIHVIYDGIELERLDNDADGNIFRKQFDIPQHSFLVGLVGLLIPWKGQELFIDAAKILKNQIPNLKMLIIGDTPYDCLEYAGFLHSRVKEENLENTVIFTGHISKMEQLYNGLDIVVSASIKPEPLGTVVIEAMAMGRPLIAPDHGGAAEMIEHNQTGLLFVAGSAASLAESTLRLFRNTPLANQLGDNAKAYALQTFSVLAHTQAIQSIYSRLLQNS